MEFTDNLCVGSMSLLEASYVCGDDQAFQETLEQGSTVPVPEASRSQVPQVETSFATHRLNKQGGCPREGMSTSSGPASGTDGPSRGAQVRDPKANWWVPPGLRAALYALQYRPQPWHSSRKRRMT